MMSILEHDGTRTIVAAEDLQKWLMERRYIEAEKIGKHTIIYERRGQ